MAPLEILERFINDPHGPRILGQPQQGSNPQLPPTTTIPSEPCPFPKDHLVTSNPASSEHSTSPSTSPGPSILSRRESGSSDTSTAPSDVVHTVVGDTSTMSSGGHNHRLPCLLWYIIGCRVSFPDSDRQSWYSHSLSHYNGAPPPTHALCIFCHTVFDSRNPSTCWLNRMNHIAEHFEMNWTIERSRPDFRVIEDMCNKGCLSEEDYKHCFEYTERPACDGLRAPDYIPEEIKKKQKAAYEQENRIPIHESRQELRDRQRGKGPSGVGPKKSRSKAIVK
jgi:hypothetical protein